MEISDINLYGGKVIFWHLNYIDTSKSISEQIMDLDQDMILIKFPNNICLDLGWYPIHNVDGSFKLIIANELDWENPIEKYKFNKLEVLQETLNMYCKKCKELSELSN